MNNTPNKSKVAAPRNWLVISLLITAITALSISFAIYLNSKWSFVPIIALITFVIVFIRYNPAGRYLWLAVSVFSLWSTATLASVYSVKFRFLWNFEDIPQGSLIIDKQGELGWLIHLFFFLLLIFLIFLDFKSREWSNRPNTKSDSSSSEKKPKVIYKDKAKHIGNNNF